MGVCAHSLKIGLALALAGLVAPALSLVEAADKAKGADGAKPRVGWRLVFKVLPSAGFWGSRSWHDLGALAAEVPLEDWLDPELHRFLRKQIEAKSQGGHEVVAERLEWALARKPELARIWLDLGSHKVFNWFVTGQRNPFARSLDPQQRLLMRSFHTDGERADMLLSLAWIRSAIGG